MTVTGSHIPQVGIYSSSPVTALGEHEMKLEGTTSISQALQTLPSVVNDGDGENVTNGSVGIATVDLRNLGSKRTLVLVDGKRLVASDESLDVDTNQIPASMVERIEVLTGGASAVYGSDAVAGVVNIILKKDFEGLTFDSQFSSTDHSDGQKNDSSFMLGVNSADGKGNITIYGEYMHRDAVSEADRVYSAHALAACGTPFNFLGAGGVHLCFQGSGTIPQGRMETNALGGPAGPGSFAPTANNPLGGTSFYFAPGGGVVPFPTAPTSFNFSPYQYYQTPGERYSLGGTAHYQITPGIDFYSRLTFSDNKATTRIGPSPMVALMAPNCGNPLMSGAVRQALFGTNPGAGPDNTLAGITAQCATISPAGLADPTDSGLNANADPNLTTRTVVGALRLTQVGPRIGINEHEAYQMVVGARGGLGYGWSYDVSAQYGHVSVSQTLLNDALLKNFQDGLQVDPATGACLNGDPNCSPLNFFTAGGLTPANIAFIRSDLINNTQIDQWDVQATATGDLGFIGGQSPWAKDPISAAFGVEYRQEHAQNQPDDNLATGNLVGNNQIVATSGGFDVGEGYLEFRVPLIQDAPLFESLQANLAYRYDHYNLSGDAHTYNVGLEWQPIDDIRFRGGFARAIRAPNVAELFTPAGGTSANSAIDPCSAAGVGTPGIAQPTAALCQATGAHTPFSASLNCPTDQCQAAVGGNPFLKPETSDTWTLGVVLTPSFLPGFTATVDFYNIKIGGFIEATPLQTILNNCYSTATNPTQTLAGNPYCSFMHRDSLGTIKTTNTGFVVDAEGNIAADKVQGFDVELNYDADLSDWGFDKAGSLSINSVGTLVTVNNTIFPGTPVVHCAGLWGHECGEPENRFKSNVRLTWTDNKGDFSLSLRWRYLSAVAWDSGSLTIPAFNYFDLSGTWSIAESVDLRAGVRNLFDKDPPITDNNSAPVNDVNGNTFPNTYDALGRVIFVGATLKL